MLSGEDCATLSVSELQILSAKLAKVMAKWTEREGEKEVDKDGSDVGTLQGEGDELPCAQPHLQSSFLNVSADLRQTCL